MVELLEKQIEGKIDKSEQNLLHTISGSARRMDEMVRALKTLLHLRQPQTIEEYIPIDEAFIQCRTTLHKLLEERDGDLVFCPIPPVRIPIIVAHNVLQNLVTNSIVHHARPKVRPRVQVVAQLTFHRLRLEVTDQAGGMSKHAEESAFEPFWRGPEATTTGTGMGLSIVRRAVELLDGTVTIQVTKNLGTTVRVELPRSAFAM